jgi:hypothetical protein
MAVSYRRQRSFPIALSLLTPSCPRGSFLAFEPGAQSAVKTAVRSASSIIPGWSATAYFQSLARKDRIPDPRKSFLSKAPWTRAS